jgi:hypothetical protein
MAGMRDTLSNEVHILKVLVLTFLLASTAFGQDSFTRNMAWCARKAEANIRATREQRPEVAKTVESYLYEYSPSHHTCVAVVAYRTNASGHPQVQISAVNMVTMQNMKGYAEIYLQDASDEQGILDAINYLFDEYSK